MTTRKVLVRKHPPPLARRVPAPAAPAAKPETPKPEAPKAKRKWQLTAAQLEYLKVYPNTVYPDEVE